MHFIRHWRRDVNYTNSEYFSIAWGLSDKCTCRFNVLERYKMKMYMVFIQDMVFTISVNLLYKPHHIPKLNCFSSRLAVVFAKYIKARF